MSGPYTLINGFHALQYRIVTVRVRGVMEVNVVLHSE